MAFLVILLSPWGQHGDHGDVETTWGQHGDNMGTT